jgi:hypothetical protein
MTQELEGSELLPCPFCGAGTTTIKENGKVWAGTKWGAPNSVSVQHWCEPVEGQPSRMLERVGRDEASAIAAWNLRSASRGLADRTATVEKVAGLAQDVAEAARPDQP